MIDCFYSTPVTAPQWLPPTIKLGEAARLGFFQVFCNGKRPGPCDCLFAVLGFGAVRFVKRNETGQFYTDPQTGRIAREWKFGRVIFKSVISDSRL